MMKIYVMRHGTTAWNEKGITQGRTNNRLSKSGKVLTEQRAKDFAYKNIDIIFCSPLMRTVQTANIINKFHNVKIQKDDRLIEIDQGIFTGKKRSQLSATELELKNSRSKDCKMESYQNVYDRIKDFLSWLEKQNFKSVLVVTHNCCASFLSNILNNLPVDFKNLDYLRNFDNAQIKCFEI